MNEQPTDDAIASQLTIGDGTRSVLYDDPRNPDLEEAIARDPSDREAYLVLADWLEGCGDARAALIRAQVADPGHHGHGKAVRKLLADHRAYFVGALGKGDTAFAWRYGYVSAIGLPARADVDHLARVLGHPSARFLDSLTVGSAALAPRFEVIARDAPRTLRQLTVSNEGEAAEPLAPLGPVLQHLMALTLLGRFTLDDGALGRPAALRALTLHTEPGKNIPVDLELPRLVSLILRGPLLPSRLELPELELADITTPRADFAAAMRWPKLRGLTLRFTDGVRPRLGELFAQDVPLERLELHDAPLGDAVAEMLVAAPFAPKLRKLVLSALDMADAGAGILAAHRDVFAVLEELDVRGNAFTEAGHEALAGMGIDELRDDSRYDEFGE